MGLTLSKISLGNTAQTKSLVIYHQNIRSIKNEKDELAILLNSEGNNPDIVCISEHHLSVNELCTFSMIEYNTATGFSWHVYKNGGVCILVKDNTLCQVLDLSSFSIERIFEACAIRITINKVKLCIMCLYRAPDGDLNQFIEQLDVMFQHLRSKNIRLIICGDTNINYLTENYKKEKIQLVLDTYNLDQIIDFPTRTSSNSSSLIDNFFLDRNIHKNFSVYPVINGLSHHDGQI
jgi:exonuclease III